MALNREEQHLITIAGLEFLSYQLAGVFVTIFLFVNSDLRTTFIYRAWTFSSLLFFYVLSGYTLRKITSGALMKISLVTGAVYYLLLVFLGKHAIAYLIPLALLDGFSGGNYWAAYNLNQYIFTDSTKREQYFGTSGAVLNLLGAVSPAIGGAIITLGGAGMVFGASRGYAALFFVVFLVLGATALFIGKLPSHEIPEFRYQHLLTHRRSRAWWIVLWQQAVWGFGDIALATITSVLFYLILKQEFTLGVAQSIGLVFGSIAGILAGRFLSKNHSYFWIGVVGLTIIDIVFALMPNPLGLWLFVIISSFVAPFLFTLVSTIGLRTIDQSVPNWKHAYHFLLERDIAMGLARIVSFLVLIFVMNQTNQVAIARMSLFVLPLVPMILGYLVWQEEHLRSL